MLPEEYAHSIWHDWKYRPSSYDDYDFFIGEVAEVIAKAVAEEREACAEVAKSFDSGGSIRGTLQDHGENIAAAIRARK